MFVFRDYVGARDAFLRALRLSPNDKSLINNFDSLLHAQDGDYPNRPSELKRDELWCVQDEFRLANQVG